MALSPVPFPAVGLCLFGVAITAFGTPVESSPGIVRLDIDGQTSRL